MPEVWSDEDYFQKTSVVPWTAVLVINEVCVEFLIDSGSAVSLINQSAVKHLNLQTIPPRLKAVGLGGPLVFHEELQLRMRHKDKVGMISLYVCRDSDPCILGRDAMVSLSLPLGSALPIVLFHEEKLSPRSENYAELKENSS